MSYTGKPSGEGPFLQGLSSSSAALQDTWDSSFISYSSPLATLANGPSSGNWRFSISVYKSSGIGERWESREPSSGANDALNGIICSWGLDSRMCADESLLNFGTDSCSYIIDSAYGSAVLSATADQCSTICEVLS